MTDYVHDHFALHHPTAEHGFQMCPKLLCADGLALSVQAGHTHYCSPRTNLGGEGTYSKVEIGYPSERIEEFMEFIDGDETTDPTDTVYGYVPVAIVNAVIEAHGGISNDA